MNALRPRLGACAAAVTLIALGACANGAPESDAPRAPVQVAAQEVNAMLMAGDAQRVIPVPAAAAAADALSMVITNVRNPDARALSIRANLRLRSDTTRTAPLGSIALFPVDQGGTFSFRIPAAGRELLASVRSEPIDLVVTLTAEPPPANAAPAAVSVDELRWLRMDS